LGRRKYELITVTETSFPKRVKLTVGDTSFPNLHKQMSLRRIFLAPKITVGETSFPKRVKLTVIRTSFFLPHKNIYTRQKKLGTYFFLVFPRICLFPCFHFSGFTFTKKLMSQNRSAKNGTQKRIVFFSFFFEKNYTKKPLIFLRLRRAKIQNLQEKKNNTKNGSQN
jgi:predicted DNA-binding transcriptional regulator AlpA